MIPDDPVQSNTVWRGVVTQTGCPEFDIVMQIKERSKDDDKRCMYLEDAG